MPDLVILDLMLPKLDGYEVCRAWWEVLVAAGEPPGRGSDAQWRVVQAAEGGDKLIGPGPAASDAQPGLPPGADDDAAGVQQAVAEAFGFGPGEVAVEGEQPGPGEQVAGDEGELNPSLVDGEGGGGQVGQPSVFGVADATLGTAASPVEGFEVGDVVVGQVGNAVLVAVPVDVGEGELGAGVGVFAAGDHAGAFGPARQVDPVGDLGDLGLVAVVAAVRGDGRLPRRLGQTDQHTGDLDGERVTHHEPNVSVAAGVQIGAQRMEAETPLVGRGRPLLVRLRPNQGGVDVDHIGTRIRAGGPRGCPGLGPCCLDPFQRHVVDRVEGPPRG